MSTFHAPQNIHSFYTFVELLKPPILHIEKEVLCTPSSYLSVPLFSLLNDLFAGSTCRRSSEARGRPMRDEGLLQLRGSIVGDRSPDRESPTTSFPYLPSPLIVSLSSL